MLHIVSVPASNLFMPTFLVIKSHIDNTLKLNSDILISVASVMGFSMCKYWIIECTLHMHGLNARFLVYNKNRVDNQC